MPSPGPSASFEPLDATGSLVGARRGWDAYADAYQAEHGEALGDAELQWCPEGLREADVGWLGDVAGRVVLEVGCGAAQGSRWVAAQGGRPVGVDLSGAQLRHARALDGRLGTTTSVVQAGATALPLRDASVDVAFSAYGALPFVADADAVHREVARVLRPGGRWVATVTHPVRWSFLDDPGEDGLRVVRSYFDRDPYVERDADGVPEWVEHHRTVGDHVRGLVAAGLVVDDLLEPTWPESQDRVWGQWSPLRGRLLPGTLVLVAHRPG